MSKETPSFVRTWKVHSDSLPDPGTLRSTRATNTTLSGRLMLRGGGAMAVQACLGSAFTTRPTSPSSGRASPNLQRRIFSLPNLKRLRDICIDVMHVYTIHMHARIHKHTVQTYKHTDNEHTLQAGLHIF